MDHTVLTLCRWVNELNSWNWPSDFPIQKPTGFDALPDRDRLGTADKYRLIDPYMRAIQTLVSQRDILYHWNVLHRKNGMTHDQFEAWWANGQSHPAAVQDDDADQPMIVDAK